MSKSVKNHVKQGLENNEMSMVKFASHLSARRQLWDQHYSSLQVLMYLALVHSDLIWTSQNPTGTKITLLYHSRPYSLSFHTTSSVHLVWYIVFCKTFQLWYWWVNNVSKVMVMNSLFTFESKPLSTLKIGW